MAVGYETASFEDFLGVAEDRYFGDGYRRRRYTVASESGHAAAIVRVEPENCDDDSAEAPHLTSIDGILIPLLLIDQYRRPVDASEVLTGLRIDAGASPWFALDRVPVTLEVAPRDDGGRTVRARVGSLRTELSLVPRTQSRRSDSRPDASAKSRTVYGSAYRDIEIRTRLWSVSPNGVQGSHEAEFANANVAASGIDGSLWPGLTAVTYVSVMGQLTQVALVAATGRGRRETGNLWLRRLVIDFSGRVGPSVGPLSTATRLIGRRSFSRGDAVVHVVDVESIASDGVKAVASLAYQEQAA